MERRLRALLDDAASQGETKRNAAAVIVLLVLLGLGLYMHFGRSGPQAAGQEAEAENFALERLEGGLVKLSDYRGRPVLVNFWASWCPPCKAEMPELAAFAAAHPDVAVLAVNLTFTETGLEEAAEFAQGFGSEVSVLLDETGSAAKRLQVAAYPTSLVFDKSGVLRETLVGQTDRKRLEHVFYGEKGKVDS
jgi:thiol-disulfide isomerase/thioredoxin